MGKTFKCGECGTKYSTPRNTPPPSPNWADGHVCIMMEVIESLIPTRSNIYGHSHKSMETGELIVSKEASKRVFGYDNSIGKPLQTGTPVFDYDEETSEARMMIIAQNGNTGEHYDNSDPDAELPPVKEIDCKKEDSNG